MSFSSLVPRGIPGTVEYVLKTDLLAGMMEVRSTGVGTGFLRLQKENRDSTPLPKPPPRTQHRIAGFLDRETERIDALIDKKRRLIDLLEEKRTATITHLTSVVHAPLAKLGRFANLMPGYAFSSASFSDRGLRLLRGVNLSPEAVRWDDTVHWVPDDPGVMSTYSLEENDIVLGMDRPWIGGGMRVATISHDDVPSLLVQRVARLRTGPGLDQDFLYAVLRSLAFKAYFDPILTGISVPHISGEQILDYQCPVPTMREQRSIAGDIEHVTGYLNSTTQRLTAQLTLLAECREALITAAVTGEIDVDAFDSDRNLEAANP